MVIIIRVLTTKKNRNSSTEKVTTMIIITVIIWTYRRNNIAKTLLDHKTRQVNAHGNIQGQKHYTEKVTSNDWQGKKQWDIYHLSWTTIPGIGGWDILILMLAKVMNTTIQFSFRVDLISRRNILSRRIVQVRNQTFLLAGEVLQN